MTIVGLLILGLLPLLGRLAPPTIGWGFGHLRYLPAGWLAVCFSAWLLLWIPRAREAMDRITFVELAGWIFGGSVRRLLLVSSILTFLFILLRTPIHLLGDGVLIGELVARGAPFRAHDLMDYLIHVQFLKAIGRIGDPEASFRLYTFASWIAGFAGTLLALLLLRRSRLSPAEKLLAFGLWLFSAPTLLFCGYVESYKFVAVAMLGFLWSGALALRKETPPWLPGLFYGFALFFHLTAIFALPAFFFLVLRPVSKEVSRRRWATSVLAPALLVPSLAVILHLWAGYNEAWFQREFLESKNQQSVLIGLAGSHGFFSFLHWKDLLNWLLLCLPVSGWLILSRARMLRERIREPEFSFLLVQVVCFLVPFLLLDRKLGAARDWDLLTPQVAGFAWLAARLCNGEKDRGGRLVRPRMAALWVAFLLVLPWLLVNASTNRSLRRFDEIRTDFPRFPRAYAAEELGKYYRDHGEMEESLGYYEECVATFTRNARTRILLGTSYLSLDRLDEAREQYDVALEIDPENWLALDSRAKLALREEDFAKALDLFRRLAPKRPGDPLIWAGYGLAAYQENEHAEAHEAFVRAARLGGSARDFYYAGLTAGNLGRWDDAIIYLNRAASIETSEVRIQQALAVAYETRFTKRRQDDRSAALEDLAAAHRHAVRALELEPDDPEFVAYVKRLESLLERSDLSRP